MVNTHAARIEQLPSMFEEDQVDAPFHFGSVSGKCVPISPSAAAPRSASQSAWLSTSPIRAPHRAFLERNLDPADHELAALCKPVQVVDDPTPSHFAWRSCSR